MNLSLCILVCMQFGVNSPTNKIDIALINLNNLHEIYGSSSLA